MREYEPASNIIELVKDNERYIARYQRGREEEVIGTLIKWAENPDLDFKWFDVAVLARQITYQMIKGLASKL